MKKRDHKEKFVYRVDGDNIIIEVSDNWQAFAEANMGAETSWMQNIIGTSIWNHIKDPETRELYRIIFKKVRTSRRKVNFSFRCDAPDMRRFLELHVFPMTDDTIRFESRILRTEPRKSVDLLQSDLDRSDDMLRICSVCKKIAVAKTQWKEAEIAIQKLKLFEMAKLPKLTHGVCPVCYEDIMAGLKKVTESTKT